MPSSQRPNPSPRKPSRYPSNNSKYDGGVEVLREQPKDTKDQVLPGGGPAGDVRWTRGPEDDAYEPGMSSPPITPMLPSQTVDVVEEVPWPEGHVDYQLTGVPDYYNDNLDSYKKGPRVRYTEGDIEGREMIEDPRGWRMIYDPSGAYVITHQGDFVARGKYDAVISKSYNDMPREVREQQLFEDLQSWHDKAISKTVQPTAQQAAVMAAALKKELSAYLVKVVSARIADPAAQQKVVQFLTSDQVLRVDKPSRGGFPFAEGSFRLFDKRPIVGAYSVSGRGKAVVALQSADQKTLVATAELFSIGIGGPTRYQQRPTGPQPFMVEDPSKVLEGIPAEDRAEVQQSMPKNPSEVWRLLRERRKDVSKNRTIDWLNALHRKGIIPWPEFMKMQQYVVVSNKTATVTLQGKRVVGQMRRFFTKPEFRVEGSDQWQSLNAAAAKSAVVFGQAEMNLVQQMPVVTVKWEDITFTDGGELESVQETSPVTFFTTGLLYDEDEEGIILLLELDQDELNPDSDREPTSAYQYIPKGVIRDMKHWGTFNLSDMKLPWQSLGVRRQGIPRVAALMRVGLVPSIGEGVIAAEDAIIANWPAVFDGSAIDWGLVEDVVPHTASVEAYLDDAKANEDQFVHQMMRKIRQQRSFRQTQDYAVKKQAAEPHSDAHMIYAVPTHDPWNTGEKEFILVSDQGEWWGSVEKLLQMALNKGWKVSWDPEAKAKFMEKKGQKTCPGCGELAEECVCSAKARTEKVSRRFL